MSDHEHGSLAAAKHAIAQKRAELGHGSKVRHLFQRFAQTTSRMAGTPWAFLCAMSIIVVWALCGPIFKFSDTWQLVINTSTTIVTFLMVFLIQNTQNRDAKAIHLKLDELIRAKQGARNSMVDLEHCTDEELDLIEAEFKRIRTTANDTGDAGNDAPVDREPKKASA
ncbi:MAG: low affinity iron permease family protein [Tepidisphaeraceae bacterium]